MKQKTKVILAVFLTAFAAGIFIFYPFMCTGLHLKIYFHDDSADTDCRLYYSTLSDPVMSNETSFSAPILEQKADIVLPSELCRSLTGIRLDFSQADSLIHIDRVELCSGGFVQKSFDASEFFAEDNLIASNDISSITPVGTSAYIAAEGIDPYLVFSEDMTRTFNNAFSHYTKTKAGICIFFVAAILLSRKKLFPDE